MKIFTKVRYLYKGLHKAMTPGQDLWDTIAIIIALDTLYDNFEMTTVSLLKTANKTIN